MLLNNLLISGTSYPSTGMSWLPPKNQIAFTATLLVHPACTTRATLSERADISSQAIVLLRNILSILGPSNAKLGESFTFRANLSPRRNRRAEKAAPPTSQQQIPYGEEPINSKLANEGSLWLRAQDFWQVVGWAFNCSIHHRGRWNVWKIWLEYMLDVLEADWKAASKMHNYGITEKKPADLNAMEHMYRNCILVQYVSEGARSSTELRRIVRSIFADGSVDASKGYTEVFKDETREENAKTGLKRKREVKLNLDEDDYGDYLQNDDDEDNAPATSQSEFPSPSATDDSLNAPSMASIAEDPDALTIRLRLLALVSHNRSNHSPTNKVSSPSPHSRLQAYSSQSENFTRSTLRSLSRFHSQHSRHLCHLLRCLISLLSLYLQSFKLIFRSCYHGALHDLMMTYLPK